MQSRRRAYRRLENVLAEDTLRLRPKSLVEIEDAVKETLANYMKVYDMHISFKRLTDGEYSIRVEGRVANVTIPNIVV